MAAITKRFGSGGAGLAPGGNAGKPDLATILRDGVDDVTELRTQFIALLAKLDADGGVTDVNYASTLTPAALKNTKA
ncbi:MAG: hypothetical protein EPO42_14405 [Gallionellaceae bacterium]|nr:MAG: hypothetical protein EPO42_14405 [Gallionellaceae bacterium]